MSFQSAAGVGSTTPSRQTIHFVLAPTVAEAAEVALQALRGSDAPPLPTPLVVAQLATRRRQPPPFGALLVRLLKSTANDVSLVIPHGVVRTPSAGDRAPSSDRRSVNLGAPAEHLTTVRLPRVIVEAATLIAAIDLRGTTATRPTLAIGLWARFAGWRQQIAVRLAPPRDGVPAEIALAVRPALILIANTWLDLSLVIATSDQIAADLAGLAARQSWTAGDDQPGPWEDALVQRATELGLGVRIPEQIAIHAICSRAIDQTFSSRFSTWVEAVGGRIGVSDIAVGHADSIAASAI